MYSDGQQALLGSRNAPWLGRGTAGSCGAWRNSPGVFDFLKKKITLLSHCWVPESCAGLQGGSFVITMSVYQSKSWKFIWLRNRLYGEKLPRGWQEEKGNVILALSTSIERSGQTSIICWTHRVGLCSEEGSFPGVFSLLTRQGVRAALTVRGQVRCQQFLRVFWLQASQHQALEEVGRL